MPHPTSKIHGRLALLWVIALVVLSGLMACSKESSSPTNPNPNPNPNPIPTPPPGPLSLGLQLVKGGLSQPTFMTTAPGDTSRLFVLEKTGAVRIIKSGTLLATPFLTVAVATSGELGLVGMAFDPGYATNGRFYISYIDPNGDSNVARYLVSSNPDVANSTPQRVILHVAQPPEDNHKGGMIAFGPDGYLWVSMGDGGGQDDPRGYGQTQDDFFGSVLRLNVAGTGGYAIPGDNPFTSPASRELWDFGLRNPWRFSFDKSTGDIYLTDVGQYSYEEINVGTTASGRGKGANYGWSVTEGNSCFNPSSGCSKTGLTAPVLVYDHGEGCAVIGGYVYRGTAIPSLQGTYFYGDHCDGWIKSFKLSGGFATELKDWPSLNTNGNITSFGQDARGELYVMTLGGNLFKIVAK